MEVSGQHYALAAGPPGKKPHTTEDRWAPESVWTVLEKIS
jgi:hypothetical protein